MFRKLSFLIFFIFVVPFSLKAKDLCVYFQNDVCYLEIDGGQYRCSIGKNGITDAKVEGDGCTPSGTYPLRAVFYGEDKIKAPIKTGLPVYKIHKYDGWCDDPSSNQYNQHVNLNNFDTRLSHEKLYREDDLYDIVVIIGYNDNPPVKGKGSAIFLHVAREGYAGTAGCVGLKKQDLMHVLSLLDKKSTITIRK